MKKRTKQCPAGDEVVDALRARRRTRHRGQMIRSGTSVGANYRAACRGRSEAEFAVKIGPWPKRPTRVLLDRVVIEGDLRRRRLVRSSQGGSQGNTHFHGAGRHPTSNRQSKIEIENHEDSRTESARRLISHVDYVVSLGHRPCPRPSGTLHAPVSAETEGVAGTCHCPERHIVEPDRRWKSTGPSRHVVFGHPALKDRDEEEVAGYRDASISST